MKAGVFCLVLTVSILVSTCRYWTPVDRNNEVVESLTSSILDSSCDNAARLADTEKLLTKLDLTFEHRVYKSATNLIVVNPGESEETVIVGAHFDKTTPGCGVIDNWTGVVMLAHLAKWSEKNELRRNYVFVAFGEEEKGLLGSAAMAAEIEASRDRRPCAMVNLDSFGFDKAWGLANISDRPLLLLAADVERERGGSFSIRNYERAISDSQSFQKIGVPSITLSGLNSEWRDYLHKERDQAVHIDFGVIEDNYRFVEAFLKKIDSLPCERFS